MIIFVSYTRCIQESALSTQSDNTKELGTSTCCVQIESHAEKLFLRVSTGNRTQGLWFNVPAL